MKVVICALTLAVLSTMPALPRNPDTAAQTTAVQAAKPAEPEGHTAIIGCLRGPDASGKYTLRSMTYRLGVEVFGSDELKAGSGGKVKLTGVPVKLSETPGEAGVAPPLHGQHTEEILRELGY